MAEKSDDIKNLFLNLGLNPSDYHEIRTAPTANVTVSEVPRRWSLLQSAVVGKPNAVSIRPSAVPAPVVAAPAPAPLPVQAPVVQPQPNANFSAGMLPAALLAAAQDIARAEVAATHSGSKRKPEVVTAPPVNASLPSALADAFVQAGPNDGLQSLFQSVKEPQTAASTAFEASAKLAERPTDQLYAARTPIVPSMADRAAAMPEVRQPPPPLLPTPPRLVDHSDEPETRYAQPPSRLGPLPAPVAAPIAPPPTAEGRLRFSMPAPAVASGHGESLQDVFRRLSRDNRS